MLVNEFSDGIEIDQVLLVSTADCISARLGYRRNDETNL